MLDARGGRPTLAVAPVSLDFGELPVGGKVEQVIRISNARHQRQPALPGACAPARTDHFGVGVPTRGTQALRVEAAAPGPSCRRTLPIAPGNDALELKVYFEPQAGAPSGHAHAEPPATSSRPSAPSPSPGGRAPAGPCSFELRPQPMLEFGNVAAGPRRGARLLLREPGRAECAVKDIHLSNDARRRVLHARRRHHRRRGARTNTAFTAQMAFKPPRRGRSTQAS